MVQEQIFCIVDMQYPFVSDEDAHRIEAVALASLAARNRNERIFVLEDTHGHSTHDRIKQALCGYDRVSYLRKSQWDGSLQVEIEACQHQLNPAHITVCGAYAEQCVLATIVGLRDRYPTTRLTMIREACCPAPTRQFTDHDWERTSRRLAVSLN